MRKYYHPKKGVYYRRDSFEADQALMGAGGGGAVGSLLGYGVEKKADGLTAGLGLGGALVSGLAGGVFVPKRIMSWWNPPPYDAPKKYPRRIPKRVVPSRIKEPNQALNLLMWEGSGKTVKDYSRNGNNGDINGAKWTDEGIATWALSFDGEDDNVKAPPNDLDVLTVTLWFKGDGTEDDTWPRQATNTPSANYNDTDGWFFSSNKDTDRFLTQVGNGTDYIRITWDGDQLDNQWHFAGISYDGETLISCLNGSFQTDTGAVTDIGNGNDITIASCSDNTHFFKGFVSLVRYYSRALSSEEISKMYQAERVLFGV